MSDCVLVYTAICSGFDDLITQPEQTIPCDLAFVPHPDRDCIYDEAAASLGPDTAYKYLGRLLDERLNRSTRSVTVPAALVRIP